MTEESAVPRPRIGQVAVVTGGSAGLGFAIAGALARAGSAVLLAGRSAERCQQAADHLTAETGSPVLGQACDVTDEDAVDQLIDRALSAYGRLDVLVTSAGVQARGTLDELSVAELRACLEVRGQQGRRRPAHPQPRGRAGRDRHHGERARAGTVPDAAERRNR